jgi:hypothetical protein
VLSFAKRADRALCSPRSIGLAVGGALVLAIMAYTAAKGFALRPHPYALSQYMYTYERGFLVRGLLGHLSKLACDERFDCVWRFVDVTSTIAIVGFILVLFSAVFARYRSYTALLLLALVGSGPLLVSVGAARGYHDAMTLGLGVLAFHSYSRGRIALTCVSFGLALLVHEIVAIYLLPLFVMPMLERQPVRRWFRRVLVVLALSLATYTVVRAGAADHTQSRFLAAKLSRSAPELSEGWSGYEYYGAFASRKESTRLRPERLENLLHPWNRPYLTPLAALFVLAASVLLRRLRWESPVYLALMVAPLGVYLVAWDYDRLGSLSGLTAVFVCAEVFRRFARPGAAVWIALPALYLVFVQLGDSYEGLTGHYAREWTALRALKIDAARAFLASTARAQ